MAHIKLNNTSNKLSCTTIRTQPFFATLVYDAVKNTIFMEPSCTRALDPVYSRLLPDIFKWLKAHAASITRVRVIKTLPL